MTAKPVARSLFSEPEKPASTQLSTSKPQNLRQEFEEHIQDFDAKISRLKTFSEKLQKRQLNVPIQKIKMAISKVEIEIEKVDEEYRAQSRSQGGLNLQAIESSWKFR